MSRQTLLVPIFFLVLCLSLVQCSADKVNEIPSVILITLDTLRVDHVSAYHPERVNTPNIDFFAQKGIQVENCYSLIPITAPAHGSLFYSMPPHLLSLYNNGQIFRPAKNRISLAEIFRENGYKTSAFVSLGVLQSQFELNHGFDLYDDDMLSSRWYLHAQEINKKVIPWIEKNKTGPFFVWVHYSDPHDPYAPPSLQPDLRIDLNGRTVHQVCLQKYEQLSLSFELKKGINQILFTVLNPFAHPRDRYRAALNEIRFVHPESATLSFSDIHFVQRGEKRSALIKESGTIFIDCPDEGAQLIIEARGNINLDPQEKAIAYKQEVEYLDQQIGVLRSKLQDWGLLDKSLVVLVGDHGEGLGENSTGFGERYFGHIHYLYDVYMKVPLIFFGRLVDEKPGTMDRITSILDVAPTILGRMGWKKPSFYQGADLFKKEKATSTILEETYTPEAIHDRFGLLRYPVHMIYTPGTKKFELYDLSSDPGEKRDIFPELSVSEETIKLQKELRQKAAEILERKKEVELNKDSLEMLKSLGYIK